MTVNAFICFGLVIAPIFLLSPAVQHFQNALEFPVYMLCAFLFPIALLPGWTTPFSYLLAPYWAARALHGSSTGGAGMQELLVDWGMMLLLSLVYLAISGGLTERMLNKARAEASLRLE
jgi:ABC-2 type transport system permease protein